MKRKVISLSALLMIVCIAFAQTDPKVLKQANKDVKQAQKIAMTADSDLNQAQKLIEGAMAYDEITSQPEIWNVAGLIQMKQFEREQAKLYLKQPYDADKMYSSLYKVYEYYFKCDEVEKNAVDKKGKPVKVKFHQENAKTLVQNRGWLINGGVKYYNDDKNNAEALKYFSLYINSAQNPMISADSLIIADTLITQIAYYASLASMQLKDYENVLKYTPQMKSDKNPQIVCYGYEYSASAYKELGDTTKWINELQEGVKRFPDYNYFVGNLLDYYNNSGKYEEALSFANNMVTNNPNDSFMQYVKGFLCQNLQKYDMAIEAYTAAVTLKPDYAEAHSNLGLVYCQLARDYSDNKATADMKSAQFKKDQEIIKGYYEKAKPHYEKVRQLKPEDKGMWLHGLYSIYYILNMEQELKEIEPLLESN